MKLYFSLSRSIEQNQTKPKKERKRRLKHERKNKKSKNYTFSQPDRRPRKKKINGKRTKH